MDHSSQAALLTRHSWRFFFCLIFKNIKMLGGPINCHQHIEQKNQQKQLERGTHRKGES